MLFKISGTIRIGKNKRKFEKEIEAASEAHARNKLYALFGSTNRVKRNQIKIESVVGG